ncbi:J517_1871 family lipoprotein [Vibrio cyclitrophicus]|uniref:Lipoprotein n=1 Tax=Vibrio sp. 1F_97 TaxID=1652827 RepID=A0A0H4A1Q1_9VIBR|nr:J517_1871 family lipoprotein [Vibrio cyclitrophicus]AKN39681.1 hypothetical protein [Vibrio sp. 1F_97]OEF29272.1 hypothetical protein OA9_09955 [Vibrio cyclitrophicus 1F97]
MLKKIIIAFGFSLALTGCQSAVTDMSNNNFVQIQAKNIPESMAATWTGTMGPYLSTFIFDKDGSGLFCYSQSGGISIQKVKVNGDLVYIQDGTKVSVTQGTNSSLLVTSQYYSEKTYTFIKDDLLKNASLECQARLQ